MSILLLSDLSNRVTKEDLEIGFSQFGTVVYVKIQNPTPSGRMAIIKMSEVYGEEPECKALHGQE